ncbi:MAG: hypothetical protein RLW62_22005, partial [Gammaproteobacteria bacterium]
MPEADSAPAVRGTSTELGCRTVLVPRTAGALSASEMQFSDIVTEAGASKLTATDQFDFDGVN